MTHRDGLSLYEIRAFGEEPHGCHNRILLGRVLTGTVPDEIMLKPREWYAERGVHFHASVKVVQLDKAARRLTTTDGEAHPCDVAVFAKGRPRRSGLLWSCFAPLRLCERWSSWFLVNPCRP